MGRLLRTVTVLPVTNIALGCEWLEQVLGFETAYLHEGAHEDEETNYAVLVRDDIQVHLILDEPQPYADTWAQAGTGYLYAQVTDVESLLRQVREASAELTSDLDMAPWGAKGFELRDPDGNLIRIEEPARAGDS